MSIEDQLKKIRKKRNQERAEMEARHRKMDIESERNLKNVRAYCRPSSLKEYNAWLGPFIDAGGEVTSESDGFEGDRFYTVNKEGFSLGRLCGVDAVKIIIPEGMEIVILDLGHCTIYDMDSFKLSGYGVRYYGGLD